MSEKVKFFQWKSFLWVMATVTVLLSIIPVFTKPRVKTTTLGYPRQYFIYEASATSDYQSYIFLLTNFIIDLACASAIAVIVLGILGLMLKERI